MATERPDTGYDTAHERRSCLSICHIDVRSVPTKGNPRYAAACQVRPRAKPAESPGHSSMPLPLPSWFSGASDPSGSGASPFGPPGPNDRGSARFLGRFISSASPSVPSSSAHDVEASVAAEGRASTGASTRAGLSTLYRRGVQPESEHLDHLENGRELRFPV